STWYRLRKFVRRNKGLVMGAALVLLTLLGGTVATAWQAVRANRERAMAIDESNKKQKALDAETAAREITVKALENLNDRVIQRLLARQPRLSEADRAFLKRIMTYFEAFATLSDETQEGRAIRALGNYRVGRLQVDLGEADEARASFGRARELYRQLVADFPEDPRHRLGLAKAHISLGNMLEQLAKPAMESEYRDGIALLKQLVDEFPTVPEYRYILAMGHYNLG